MLAPATRATAARALGMLAVASAVGLTLAASTAAPAAAHDATSDVFADVATAGGDPAGLDVAVALDLEYDLLMKSAWLTEDVYGATDPAAQRDLLEANQDAVDAYVLDRFQVTYDAEVCAPAQTGADIADRGGRSYAALSYRFDCDGEPGAAHTVSSALFPDAETFVHSTETIVAYDLDGEQGSAILSAAEPTLTTGESRLWHELGEFFVHGAEHMLFGLDHVLFLLALIVGSRRLHDVVLVATSFTVAHSVTFLLAATGVVQAPASVVEPVIALSIAVVAAGHLWALRRPAALAELEPARAPRLTRADAVRLGVVFAFGLVHGLGFAGALGIDEPWSWTLLGSLLVFNVGIEVVQLGIIVVLFPLLALLCRRAPVAARWVTGAVAGGVALAGLWWVVERTVLA
jgi:hypothetical protein